jgi:hypothetical protein
MVGIKDEIEERTEEGRSRRKEGTEEGKDKEEGAREGKGRKEGAKEGKNRDACEGEKTAAGEGGADCGGRHTTQQQHNKWLSVLFSWR